MQELETIRRLMAIINDRGHAAEVHKIRVNKITARGHHGQGAMHGCATSLPPPQASACAAPQ